MTIRITSKQEGFRRCGVAHPATATDHPDDAFTAAQLEALQAEPMLLVELIGEKSTPSTTSTASMTVPQVVALVSAALTLEELDQLAEGEGRKGILDAIAKRRVVLAQPEPSDSSEKSDPSDQSEGAQQSTPSTESTQSTE